MASGRCEVWLAGMLAYGRASVLIFSTCSHTSSLLTLGTAVGLAQIHRAH